MTRRRPVTVASIRDDGSTELIELAEHLRRLDDRGSQVDPPKEPETLHEAMRDLSLSRRWETKPSDKAVEIIIEDYGRTRMGLVRHNKATSDKRSKWQEWASEYFARHPTASKIRAAEFIKIEHQIPESVGYIAKKIAILK
jgi:hypothetical protein